MLSLEDLTEAPDNGKNIFNLTLHTDGFGASVIFVRRKANGGANQKGCLELEDFQTEEVNSLFLPVTVDSGRTKVFTAIISHSSDKKEFRSCS